MSCYHEPIMLREVVDILNPGRGGIFVDGTLGGGGHSEAILKSMKEGSSLIGIDRDGEAIEEASRRLGGYGGAFTALRGNFFNMRELLLGLGIESVDGILLDLGVSSHQLDTKERGFSYHHDAPLDMRMDLSRSLSAFDVINGYSPEELSRIFRDYGEERNASRIARAIANKREKAPIKTTAELAETIRLATPPNKRYEGKHPARRVFQAVRIEVNNELEGLKQALEDAHALLKTGGRLACITFHSLEDRIVKQLFRELENPCVCPPRSPVCVCKKASKARQLTKKPIVASERECEGNHRARSAKLRAIEKP